MVLSCTWTVKERGINEKNQMHLGIISKLLISSMLYLSTGNKFERFTFKRIYDSLAFMT